MSLKLELKNGRHTYVLPIGTKDGEVFLFPRKNVELALEEGTEETLRIIDEFFRGKKRE